MQNPVRRTGMPELWDGWPGAKAAGMPKQRQDQRVGRIWGLCSTVITDNARDRRKRKAPLRFNDELLRCFY